MGGGELTAPLPRLRFATCGRVKVQPWLVKAARQKTLAGRASRHSVLGAAWTWC